MIDRLRTVVSSLAWVVLIVLIALGAAGLVAATDPGTGAADTDRLAYDEDARVTTMLDTIESDVTGLADDIDTLGTHARAALAAMVAGDLDAMEEAIAAGDERLSAIDARSQSIRGDLDQVPFIDTPEGPLHVSDEVRRRHARLTGAVAATSGLEAEWLRLTTGAAAAGRLSHQLEEHDRLVAKAAGQGRDAKYKAAMKTLAQGSEALAESRAFRDGLVATVDVSTLDRWLERNETYDAALSDLYDALDSVGGRVTSKVRKAIAAEEEARERLPPDSRGMIVIMADIAQGGLNSAVVAIEEAKSGLADALEPVPVESSPAP